MTWTTDLPTEPGWYYRRLIGEPYEELDIVHIYSASWRLDPINLWMERCGTEFSVPVSDYVKAATKYEFQPVKPPEDES